MSEKPDLRTKLGFIFIGVVVLAGTLLTLDRVFFRPREPIARFEDRDTLEAELARVMSSPTVVGVWSEKSTIHRETLVVSANLLTQGERSGTVEAISKLMLSASWSANSSTGNDALASFCKGRYRANLWLLDPGRVALSLSVKRYRKDRDC
jgi:hypothetical protein